MTFEMPKNPPQELCQQPTRSSPMAMRDDLEKEKAKKREKREEQRRQKHIQIEQNILF